MTAITRRGAMLGATAAVAVDAVPTVVATQAITSTVNTALRQRYAEWERANQAFDRALDNLEVVENKVWAAAKERGIKHGADACRALNRELGVEVAHDEEARACHEDAEAYERFLNVPADSLQDMALKYRVALRGVDAVTETKLGKAMFRDFERLIGGMEP